MWSYASSTSRRAVLPQLLRKSFFSCPQHNRYSPVRSNTTAPQHTTSSSTVLQCHSSGGGNSHHCYYHRHVQMFQTETESIAQSNIKSSSSTTIDLKSANRDSPPLPPNSNTNNSNGSSSNKTNSTVKTTTTNQEQSAAASELVPPKSSLLWLTSLIQIIVLSTGVIIVLYLQGELSHESAMRDQQSEQDIFMRSGDPDDLFYFLDEEDISAIYRSESKLAAFARRIKMCLRTFQLAFIFTPAAIFYLFQFVLSPQYYDIWCRILVRSLEFAGPCFIKLGQWMATRPDLFSDQLCEHLSNLHSKAPMHHFAHTKSAIEQSFGRSIDEIFDEFDRHAIASGAIAQVHKAKMKGEDRYVAVKVRHPGVAQSIVRDLSIIYSIARVAQRFETFAWLNLKDNVLSFSRNMRAQTNLVLEAQSLAQFAKNFRYIPSIVFATPIMYSSSVLVQSFEEGLPVTEYISDKYPQSLRTRIATLGTNMYLKMMFIDNLIHADLHPGNILVRLDKNQNPSLVVLDTGMMATLSPDDRRNFIDLFSAVIAGQSDEAARLMIERGKSGDLIKKDPHKVAQFKQEMSNLIDYVMDRSLSDLEVGHILQQALSIGRKYQVILESNFTTLVIGTIIIEGLGRRLNPDFNFIEAAKPYLRHESSVRDAYVVRYLKRLDLGKATA